MKKTLIFALVACAFAGCKTAVEKDKNTFSYKVGSYEVVLLSEGQRTGGSQNLIGATPEMLEKYTDSGAFPSATNAFLVKTPDKIYLIDAGTRPDQVVAGMQSVGVCPEQVSTLLITHFHGDHVGGMLRDGEVVYTNAELHVAQLEFSYWNSDVSEMPENQRTRFQRAQEIFAAYAGNLLTKLQPIKLCEPQGDGIFAIEAYGHTPGHTMFLVRSGGEQLLIWGDLTHAMAVQMPHPEVAVTFDVDPEQAVKTRLKVLEYVTEHKIPIAGSHIAYPSIGRVEKAQEGGYRFVPVKHK